jgi:CHAT domain-containing protein/tetratricopeptide (TPR) repeat protein
VLPLMAAMDLKSMDAASRANIDLGYGVAVAATGDFDQARVLLERSIAPMRKSGAVAAQAGALNALAVIEDQQGQPQKAIALVQQGLDLQSLINPKQDRLHVLLLQNIAAFNAHAGDYREARDHELAALGILKKYKNDLLRARSLSAMAEISLKSADAAQAEAYVKSGIAVAEKINDDCSLWRDYTILARIQLVQENPVAAKESLTSALSFFRSPQAGPFPAPEGYQFPSSREELGQQLVAMVAKQGMAEQALLTCEQLKEESFNDEWHTHGGFVKEEDRDIYNELMTMRAHLHASENTNTPDRMIGEWKKWLGRFNTLVSTNKNLARMIAPVPNSVQDVVKGLQARHATAVEYLVASDQSVVFTLEPTGRISSTVLPVGSKRLQTQVNALLAAPLPDATSAQTDQHQRAILQSLYGELIPPSVRNLLPKTSEQMVVIIPDGCLFNLPFAALIDTQGKFLVENHLLTMAASMGGFLDSRPKYADDLSVLITSQPNVNGFDDANMIAGILEPGLVTRLAGRNADLGSLQEQVRNKAVVHLTSNTPLSSVNPMRSLIPIVNSDGTKRVTADRLFSSHIPSDLMVMSSTSVNDKDVQGSAVQVFSRGLSYAGVRNVLMSLWVEPDNVRASELMDFYRGKQEGLNQAQSLRKAEMLSMAKDPSPRSWAAFQLLGPGF